MKKSITRHYIISECLNCCNIAFACIYILCFALRRLRIASFSFSAVRSKVSAWRSALRGIYSDSCFDWSMKNGGKIVANQIWIFSEGRFFVYFWKTQGSSTSTTYHLFHSHEFLSRHEVQNLNLTKSSPQESCWDLSQHSLTLSALWHLRLSAILQCFTVSRSWISASW